MIKVTQYNSLGCEIDCRVIELGQDEELVNQINDAVKDIALNNVFDPGDCIKIEEL